MTQGSAPAAGTGKTARVCAVLVWIGLGVILACGLAELLAGLGYRLTWWRLGTGIQIMRWSATIALGAAVVALVATALACRYGTRSTLLAGALGLLLSVAVAGPPVYLWRQAGRLPHIHDVSTDTDNPPRYVAVVPLRKGASNSIDYRAEVAAQQKQGYPDIVPGMLDVPPEQALQRAERAARALGWDIVAIARADMRIEATDTTLLFGFKDDIVIRITPSGRGSRVDMRSLSRVGGSDFGVNAKRIRKFMRQLAAT